MPNDFPPSNPPAQQSNWPFLVIAVLMAVVLWLFVRTGGQTLAQRSMQLSVAVTNGQNLTVVPHGVDIKLEGVAAMVDRLAPEDVAVIADLAGHKPGDLVTLTVVPPQGFKVLGTSATQVRVVAVPSPATH